MENSNNSGNDAFGFLHDCDDMTFTPQLHHSLLVNSKIELCPPILITSSSNIDRHIEVWVEKVLCDNILVSGVIYNKLKYTSTDKCGSKLFDVVKCYNTPFQATLRCPCHNLSLCTDDYTVHASINNVIYSNFSCINFLYNSCKLTSWKLSEKYLIYIAIQKKCEFSICEK
ncbi:MAG: hypothetical protein RR128_05545 [Clostridium sp.]